LHVAHAHGPRGSRWADDPAAIAEMKRAMPRTVAACFELIETQMLKGPWVLATTIRSATPICSPSPVDRGRRRRPGLFPKVIAIAAVCRNGRR